MSPVRKTIFHIDDDVEILNLVKSVFEKRLSVNYQGFETVEDFLHAIKNKQPDLCIIDLNLTESLGAGFAVTKAIRNKAEGKMPIIVMSKRSHAKDISLALEFGASDFLAKPVDFDLLIEKVMYLLRGAESNMFPVHRIKKPVTGTLEVHLKPVMLDEAYLYVKSKFFILKNTTINMQHTLLSKIFGESKKDFLVHDCQLESHEGQYILKLIPKNPKDDYFDKIHRYLLEQT